MFAFSLLLAAATAKVQDVVDPISDMRGVFVVLRDGATFVSLGCSDTADRKSFQAKIDFDQYLGDATAGLLAGGREVEYRFDQRKPASVLWHSHNTYVFATPPEARPVLFATELRGTTRLTVRSYNYAGEPKTFTLTYADPTTSVDAVLERCGFTPDGSKLKKAR